METNQISNSSYYKYRKEILVCLSIFFFLYFPYFTHYMLPPDLDRIVKSPLFKILGIFSLMYIYTQNVYLSLFSASIIVFSFELFQISKKKIEEFCSTRLPRSCPKEDYCIPEVDKQENLIQYLDETDNFIEDLYEYLEVDSPDYLQQGERKTDLVRIQSEENPYKYT